MKKTVLILLITFLLLGCFSACGGKEALPDEPSEETAVGNEQHEEIPKDQSSEEKNPEDSSAEEFAEETETPAETEEEPKPENKHPHIFRVIDYDDPRWFDDAHLQDLDVDWPTIYIDDLSSKDAMISRGDWYFDHLLNDTKVTDVMLCCFEQISYIPAETMDWVHEEVAKRCGNGYQIPGFERASGLYTDFYNAIESSGLDWYQYAIDACEKRGARPWIYLRMNDHHNVDNPDSIYHDSFYYEAREKGWLIGNESVYGGRVANAYDFSNREVRDWMLTYIEEVLGRYDAFGLQLDFVREIYCFDYLNDPDCAETMTAFIRDVADLLKEAEARNGHDMKLMIRLGRSVEGNLTYGFDVTEWVDEGLIDAIVVAPHGEFLDNAIPVADWKALVGEDVAVFPGMESNLLQYKLFTTAAHVKGLCAGYFAQGADGIYFNNFYQMGSEGPNVWGLNRENVEEGIRTYVITKEDYAPKGAHPYDPLPIILGASRSEITVDLGKVKEGDFIYLEIGYVGGSPVAVNVTVNGVATAEIKPEEVKDGKIPGWYFAQTGEKRQADSLLRYRFDNVGPADELTIAFEGGSGTRIESVSVTARAFSIP